jgi:uncharacterized protein
MILKIGSLLKESGNTMEISMGTSPDLILDEVYPIKIKSKIHLLGEIENLSGVLYFNGCIEYEYGVQCSRCLKDLEREQIIDVEGTFSSAGSQSEKEDYIYKGKELDFSRFVADNVLLNIDSKYLCEESCKGLCSSCGKNLNLEECSCKDDHIDPRFEKLKDLL